MGRAVAVLAAALVLTGCTADRASVVELSGPTMGTRYSVQLSPPPQPQALEELQRRIDERLNALNAVFSTYQDDSDLVRFNRNQTTDWQPVPAELAELVRRAQRVSKASAGRFDITVGPLVDLWGFGSTGDRDAPPAHERIAEQLARVGYRHLAWRLDPPALRKTVPNLEVDLSSIAKGWAVDQIGALLDGQGIGAYLVEIGGETLIRGEKSDGRPWRIAIERPSNTDRLAQGVLVPGDVAVATSGDYRNFFEHESRRYGHTIDPGTGYPIRHRVASVTVLADDCTTADAWATALMALGENRGPETAERLGLAALFIIGDGEALTERPTAAFADTVRWQTAY